MYVTPSVIRPRLEESARATIPTRHGPFEMVVFRSQEILPSELALSPEPLAILRGDVRGKSHVPVRVHSECITSEVFGSLKCDCKQQLEAAQAEIARRGLGVIVYLRQEGRGIGLANKIRAYALQQSGADTVDANRMLGLPDDARQYGTAAAMLEYLGVRSIQLMSNNPDKVTALQELGVEVESRIPVLVPVSSYAEGYLQAKRLRMHHLLPTQIEIAEACPNGPTVYLPDAE